MDLLATMFGLAMLLLSAFVAYHWGIKPERQEKKRRAELALAQMRRQARTSRQRTV
jgi:hypothetical protein